MKCAVLAMILMLFFVQPAQGLTAQETYEQQADAVGISDLQDALPDSAKDSLENIGADPTTADGMRKVSAVDVFRLFLDNIQQAAKAPFQGLLALSAVILLLCLVEGLGENGLQKPLNGAADYASTLAVCVIVLTPFVGTISRCTGAVRTCATFMMALVPVLAGILIAAGRVGSAAAFSTSLYGVSQFVAQTLAGLTAPVTGGYLSLCVAAGVSGELRLKGLLQTIQKTVTWCLGLSMTVFVGVLGLQNALGQASDGAGLRTAKFVLGSFVPVVGSALGDAAATVQGSLSVLKSGVGVYGILALAVILVPVVAEIFLWKFTLGICSGAAQLFSLNRMADLFSCLSGALSVLLAVILSCGCLFVVSTALIAVLGGSL